MKSKRLFLVALLMAVLPIGEVFSQGIDAYFFVACDHTTGISLPADTVPRVKEIGCDTPIDVWEAGHWTRETIFKYLYDKGIGIKTCQVGAGLQGTYNWGKDAHCEVSLVSYLGCSSIYERRFIITSTEPGISPGSAPPDLVLTQRVTFRIQGDIPEQWGNYLPEITCPPGVDIMEGLNSINFPANNTAAIDSYISQYPGFPIPSQGEGCWGPHTSSYIAPPYEYYDLQEKDDGHCSRTYTIDFHIENGDCDGDFHYYQIVHLPAPNFSVSNDLMETTEVPGCKESDLPPQAKDIGDLMWYGVRFENLMYDDMLGITCEEHSEPMFSDEEDTKKTGMHVTRLYTVTDHCTNCQTMLTHNLYFGPTLQIFGPHELKTIAYDDKGVPPQYTNIKQLEEVGLVWKGTCGFSVSLMSEENDENDPSEHPTIIRKYRISHPEFSGVCDSVTQKIEFREQNPQPFSVELTDLNCDKGEEGGVTITDANTDKGCPDCLNENLWYYLEFDNHADGNTVVIDARGDPDIDIWDKIDLDPGVYTMKMYASCDQYPSATDPIWEYDFTINSDDYGSDRVIVNAINNAWSIPTQVSGNNTYNVQEWTWTLPANGEPGSGTPGGTYTMEESAVWFYGTNRLLAWVHSVCGYNQDPDDEWMDERDKDWFPHGEKQISYTWQGDGAVQGYPKNKFDMIGMTRTEYDNSEFTKYYHWSEYILNSMDHKLFDGRTWQFNLSKGRNDMRVSVGYVKGDKIITEEADFTVYFQCVNSSYDPNELHGPEGYDTVVHFINAMDPINYTIMFENDPEFATSPASRVKITCPLNDKGEVNTFRFGSFGFGDFTFEMPPMASQYSNRLDLTDSLGVWLDVTAGVQIPENYAYWIFQSIDPATGLPPTGSLGFLPVNDTVNPGNGEGYVTFIINPQEGLVTGDEIAEQAHIVFDQNDTVPTNIYTNRFDAVAPTSTLYCDSTQADTGVLFISFDALDDANGSGVDYVNLFVNIDDTNYELVGKLEPDSLFQYQMTAGTKFEFLGQAVDHVNNKEAFKNVSEFTYIRGNAPSDLRLTASSFDEDASLFTVIGDFITTDDQTSNVFHYSLVDGMGSDHNELFSIVGKSLVTNNDFRCYGLYDYSIRVRSVDLSGQYVEKVFNIHALRNMTPEITTIRDYICPNQPFFFASEWQTSAGVYYDTLQTFYGCDSIVRLVLDDAATPLLDEVADEICFGYDYDGNGFNLSADTLLQLTQGWTMQNDMVLSLDRYTENFYGCYDTTRLALTVHPAFNYEDAVAICPTDLPYQFQGVPFYHDTTAVFSYQTGLGCDSVYTLNLSVKQIHDQNNDFANGWNWFSTFVDQSDGDGLAKLEGALNGNGQVIKSKTAFVTYDPDYNMWFGNLEEINNTSMFMVKMRDPQATLLTGCPADIDTIRLAPGWTWIGYPLTDTTGVNQLTPAIGGAPSNDDVIKSKQSFAMYNAEFGIWFGSLDDLTPGVGYMYLSNAGNEKPLYYGNRQRKSDVQPLDIPAVHWNADDKPFANNMTVMGLISLDGQNILSDTLEVGAFVNNEQRGSGRAVYIEQMDAYRIFLTVHGEDGETVDFRLFNHPRNKERRIRCEEQLTFLADRHFGTLENPYVFAFETYYDKYIQAEICEGEYYTENNFRVFEPGTYFKEEVTAQGNDSVVRLDLAVNPVYHVQEEVVAVEFPYEYEGVVFDKPGTFVLPFQTAAACDSVLEVTVTPYEGLRELLISPLPASRTQRVSLYYPFTQAEQRGVVVEVYTVGGNLLQSKRPTRFPIELDPFPTSGTYMVKITMGTGEVLSGKIIIR